MADIHGMTFEEIEAAARDGLFWHIEEQAEVSDEAWEAMTPTVLTHYDHLHPDGSSVTWGYMDGDVFRPLPKQPLLLHGGTPPFDVTMWDGAVRHIIEDPAN